MTRPAFDPEDQAHLHQLRRAFADREWDRHDFLDLVVADSSDWEVGAAAEATFWRTIYFEDPLHPGGESIAGRFAVMFERGSIEPLGVYVRRLGADRIPTWRLSVSDEERLEVVVGAARAFSNPDAVCRHAARSGHELAEMLRLLDPQADAAKTAGDRPPKAGR